MTRKTTNFFAATARLFSNAAPPGYPSWTESQRQMLDEAAMPTDQLDPPCTGCGSRLPATYYRAKGLIACCPAKNAEQTETIT